MPPDQDRHDSPNLRGRVLSLWEALDARGATVHRIALDELPDGVLAVLGEHEAARLRALHERDTPPPTPADPRPGAQRAALRALLTLIARTVNTYQETRR